VALKGEFPRVKFGFGEEGLLEAATHGGDDGYLVNAVVGSAGLRPTVAAIKKRRNILLANKENSVVAGGVKLAQGRGRGRAGTTDILSMPSSDRQACAPQSQR